MNKTPTANQGIHKLSLLAASALLGPMLLSSQARAQLCDLTPIALSAEMVANVAPGTVLNDIWNGAQAGSFGWLTWSGAAGEPALVNSLAPAGDSYTYVNPDDADDHELNVGDWVLGKPGVSNTQKVRDALAALKGYEIVVPVWDYSSGKGGRVAYRVAGFARVRILSSRLPSENRITVLFLGFADCSSPAVTSIPAKVEMIAQVLPAAAQPATLAIAAHKS